MSLEHGLYVPQIEHLSSLEAIVGYLRTVVTEYNECLYCGTVKPSAQGIRQHMLDKGHCMINLEREPELLEFWEFSDSEAHDSEDEDTPKPRARKRLDQAATESWPKDQHALPSGKVVRSKGQAREARLLARRIALAAKETPSQMNIENSTDVPSVDPSENSSESLIKSQEGSQGRTVTAIAARDAAGLVGISDQQLRSLVTVERKMQRQQAIVRASASWADEKGGTHQKHYKQKMNLRDG